MIANSQCVISLPDIAVCNYHLETSAYMADSLTISGGTPPYTYAWEYDYVNQFFPTFTMDEFDVLDDPSSPNPIFTGSMDNPTVIYLTVTDSNGFSCQDSISILTSSWSFNLQDKTTYINIGDSVQLYTSATGGIPPYTYLWNPPTGLVDPTDLYTIATPDTTTYYTLTITDSIGCQAIDEFRIIVNTVGIDESNSNTSSLNVYPNPTSGIATFSYTGTLHPETRLIFQDGLGRIVKDIALTSQKFELNTSEWESAVYFYHLLNNSGLRKQGKLIVTQ